MTWSICRPKISPEATLGNGELPLVRLHGGYLGPKLLEIIPPKPLQSNALAIKIPCRAGGFLGSPALWTGGGVGNAASDDYMPLAVRIEGRSQKSTVYLHVNSAANHLLVSKEEIRGAQNNPGYWGDRVITVHTCVAVIQREEKCFTSPRDIYRKMLVIHSLALETLQEKKVPRGIACKIQEFTVLQNHAGQLEILYPLGELGQGGFGSVDKIVSFASGKLSALKSNQGVMAKNSVTESIMSYQTSYSSNESSLMTVNKIIERDDGYFDEEYELCYSSIRNKYGTYDDVRFKDLCKSVVLALEEFRQVGYAYLDVKPDNVFETRNVEGKEVFKLGDFDLSSPYIKDVTGFKKWLNGDCRSIVHTRPMNIEDDIRCLRFLRDLGIEVLYLEKEEGQDSFGVSIEGLVQLLRDRKITNFLQSQKVEELIHYLEKLEFEGFYDSLLSIFAKKAEQTVVFQLGVMLYLGLGGRFPYQLMSDQEKYLQFMLESYPDIQRKINSSKKVKDAEYKNLIIRMLNPNSELRPSLAEISGAGCFAL